MQAVFITKAGGPQTVTTREIPPPEPQNGQVLVKVYYAGVNYAEVVARRGIYPDAPRFPFIPGYEYSGVVAKADPGGRFQVGQKVFGLSMFGAQAEYLAVSPDNLFAVPPEMTLKEAAAIPVNYLTAYVALFQLANLRPRQRVLIHSAAGGVGTAAVQLALSQQAEVFGTTSSQTKIEYLQSLGVHHPINYCEIDFAAEVKRLTNNKGVDIVLDPVGGSTFAKSLRLLAPGGRIICYGVADMAGSKNRVGLAWKFLTRPRVDLIDLMQNNCTVSGLALNRLLNTREQIAPVITEILRFYEQRQIRPIVSACFPITQASQAHRLLESGKTTGKILLIINDEEKGERR